MFIVCHKEKIKSYIVSFFTVLILLGIAFYMKNESDTVEASSSSNNANSTEIQTQK